MNYMCLCFGRSFDSSKMLTAPGRGKFFCEEKPSSSSGTKKKKWCGCRHYCMLEGSMVCSRFYWSLKRPVLSLSHFIFLSGMSFLSLNCFSWLCHSDWIFSSKPCLISVYTRETRILHLDHDIVLQLVHKVGSMLNNHMKPYWTLNQPRFNGHWSIWPMTILPKSHTSQNY